MTSSAPLTIACFQANSALGDVEANLVRALAVIAEAADAGADIVLFPETYLQGYCADELLAATAEPVPGPATDRLRAAAAENDIHVVMGMARAAELHPYFVYNSAVLLHPDGRVDVYDKVHLGTVHPVKETSYYAPGRSAPVFDTRFGRISLQICNDLWYPEISRIYALEGAALNVVLSAGPRSFAEQWTTMLKARAIENQSIFAYVNVAGRQKEIDFFGGSQVVMPDGELAAQGPLDAEALVLATVDLNEVERARRRWMMLRDRVPSLYERLGREL